MLSKFLRRSYKTTPTPSTLSISKPYASSLSNLPKTRITTLSNGFRIATETTTDKTATVGIWIDAGSRFETEANNGVAHFLEHLSFKGTSKRSQTALEKMVENMGAHLNAYTSREQTVYYSKCLGTDVNTMTEVLADMVMASTLDSNAVERERSVINREAEEVDKNKEEVVFDHLHGIAFQGNSLGYTILGPKANIDKLTRNDLQKYVEDNYTAERMVLAASGGVDHDNLVKVAEKVFGGLKVGKGRELVKKPTFVGSDLRARFDDHPTAHVAFAVEGVSWTSPDYWPLLVAQTIIGAWDRSQTSASQSSSKLAQEFAKHNFGNSFMSFNTSYTDTGLFGTYIVTEKSQNLDDITHALQQEWHRLCQEVTEIETFRAKNQLKTALLLSLDGTTPSCEDIGRQMLVYGKRLSPWEIDGLIENVTARDVMEACKKYIYDKEVSVVGYGRVEGLQDYNRIRAAMSPLYT